MVRSRSILASNGNFAQASPRVALDATAVAFAIALLAIVTFALPGSAADAGSGPVASKLITTGPVLVKGQNAANPLPAWMLQPPPSHPLSKRAQAIKNGLLMPATPGAKAILAEPPLPESITGGRVPVREFECEHPPTARVDRAGARPSDVGAGDSDQERTGQPAGARGCPGIAGTAVADRRPESSKRGQHLRGYRRIRPGLR